MRKIINGQFLIKESVKCLISKTLSILKDIAINKNLLIRKYTRTIQETKVNSEAWKDEEIVIRSKKK